MLLNALTIDRAKLDADIDRVARAVLSAGTRAVAEETRGLETDLEQITRLAVPGRLWRAWKSEAWPKGGKPARAPEGRVFVNGGSRSQGAIAFFTQPGRITAGGGQYLAIPTPAAGPRGRKRDLTPGEWERRNGARLRFVYRSRAASLLVLDQGVLSGKKQIGRLNSARRREKGRGNATVVIFVLIPFVNFSPRFAVEPLIRRREGMLAQNFERAVRALPDVR